MTLMVTVIPSIALAVFSRPIIDVLLGWGEFDSAAVRSTSEALSGLAIGLVGFSLYLFVLRGFYSHGDTRTPFFINCAENGLNILLAIVLVDRFGVRGLGLAFAIAYLVSALIALLVLRRRHGTVGPLGLVGLGS
jgi:putative peptidoglycan lipid II flippase